jgi:hypothetical protein
MIYFVAATDAPRIGERAAKGGRGAMECGDERAGAKRRCSVRAPSLLVLRAPTFILRLSRLRRRNDAPLIGERAARRGRAAMEAGDEHAGVKRGHSFVRPPTERLRRATRPGTRPLVNDLPADWEGVPSGRGEPCRPRAGRACCVRTRPPRTSGHSQPIFDVKLLNAMSVN